MICAWKQIACIQRLHARQAEPADQLVLAGTGPGKLRLAQQGQHTPSCCTFLWPLSSHPPCDMATASSAGAGDPGASVFIPLLQRSLEAKQIRKFRITAWGMSRAVGGQIGELMKAHFPSKKKVVKKKKNA